MSQKKNRSPLEDLANQSFISCNDQVEQNFVVDNNVINDSIQQTTLFQPSFPQTMVITHAHSKCLYHPLDQKVLCFRVSIYLEHLQNVYC